MLVDRHRTKYFCKLTTLLLPVPVRCLCCRLTVGATRTAVSGNYRTSSLRVWGSAKPTARSGKVGATGNVLKRKLHAKPPEFLSDTEQLQRLSPSTRFWDIGCVFLHVKEIVHQVVGLRFYRRAHSTSWVRDASSHQSCDNDPDISYRYICVWSK
jgi:hypothetical protein